MGVLGVCGPPCPGSPAWPSTSDPPSVGHTSSTSSLVWRPWPRGQRRPYTRLWPWPSPASSWCSGLTQMTTKSDSCWKPSLQTSEAQGKSTQTLDLIDRILILPFWHLAFYELSRGFWRDSLLKESLKERGELEEPCPVGVCSLVTSQSLPALTFVKIVFTP